MGVQGDVKDLSTILDWTTRFWSRSDSFTWTQEFRLAVCQASKALCRSFEDAELEHRRFHMLTDVDYDVSPSWEQDVSLIASPLKESSLIFYQNDFEQYRSFLAGRRATLRSRTPPVTAVTGSDWAEFNPERLLRLTEGDPGYINWAHAKSDFKEALRFACVQEYGDDFSATGRHRLRSIANSFPQM